MVLSPRAEAIIAHSPLIQCGRERDRHSLVLFFFLSWRLALRTRQKNKVFPERHVNTRNTYTYTDVPRDLGFPPKKSTLSRKLCRRAPLLGVRPHAYRRAHGIGPHRDRHPIDRQCREVVHCTSLQVSRTRRQVRNAVKHVPHRALCEQTRSVRRYVRVLRVPDEQVQEILCGEDISGDVDDGWVKELTSRPICV